MKQKTINLPHSWRPGDGTLIHAGVYRVPQDMPEALAARAIAEAGAIPSPAPAARDRRSRSRRKGPAPENKAAAGAPGTKAEPTPSDTGEHGEPGGD